MTPEQAAALRKPFDAKAIGQLPKGGAQLDFVGHAAVTDRLLAIDPAWTWEPLALDEHGLPAYDRAGGLWIKLTVCGTTILGYGDGPDPKQRIGDAIRNAAMRRGVALDLWSRQELEGVDPNGGDAAAHPRTVEAFAAKHGPAPEVVTQWIADWCERVDLAVSRDVLLTYRDEAKAKQDSGFITLADASDLALRWKQRDDTLAEQEAKALSDSEPSGHLEPREVA